MATKPILPQYFVDDAVRDDPEAARAAYLAEFRSDFSNFVDSELIANCTRPKPQRQGPVRPCRWRT
ncbi:hypothetical protein [uncultured Sulfitobacter sp.]|uniref:hypothetical protein n=1 Tax=uncultured Sulfitobacter sp. TaxID=191468 RepID=UPI00260FA1FE|nr:hypothetical protein [uncultured Sulfitobacter sp.]